MPNIPAILQSSLKGNTDILHFLSNDIHPEDESSVTDNCKGVVHRLSEQEAKLMSLLQVFDIVACH